MTLYALNKLKKIKGLRILGPKNIKSRGGIVSFIFADIHPHDIACILGEAGVAIRAGHHCAEPLHRYWEIPASCRLSLAIYNTKEDIDRLCDAIINAKRILTK